MELFNVSGKSIKFDDKSRELKNVKSTVIVEAVNFSDAETMGMNCLLEHSDTVSIDGIKRVNYEQILTNKLLNNEIETHNETGTDYIHWELPEDNEKGKIYEIVVEFIEEESNGKVKKTKSKFLTPAENQIDAIKDVNESLSESVMDFSIISTKETSVEAITLKFYK